MSNYLKSHAADEFPAAFGAALVTDVPAVDTTPARRAVTAGIGMTNAVLGGARGPRKIPL
jgi:hypothetical protein